jgi:hypothetical protein
VLKDACYSRFITHIKDITATLEKTERERSKQQQAIFGVMSMINIAGGCIPDSIDKEC